MAHSSARQDDAVPLRPDELSAEEQEAIAAFVLAYEERQRRARALDERLRALLAPEHVAELGVSGLTSQWSEAKLAALEALAALIPQTDRAKTQ